METRRHRDLDLVIHTSDHGWPAAGISTSVFLDGDIVVTHRQQYPSQAQARDIVALMTAQHVQVLNQLSSGALDAEVMARFDPTKERQQLVPQRQIPTLGSLQAAVLPRGDGDPWRIGVEVADPKSLLSAYFTRGKEHGLDLPVLDVPLGQPLVLRVKFQAVKPVVFEVPAVVMYRRNRGEPGGLLPALGVNFASTGNTSAERMIEYALGIMDPALLRAYPRFETDVAVVLERPGEREKARVITLSEGGAFVSTGFPRAPGEELVIRFKAGLFSSLRVPARVTWSRVAPPPGMAVVFEVDDDRVRQDLAAMVEKLCTGEPLPFEG
jgi:hypothetical protein